MISFRHVHPCKLALIGLLGALGACQTVSTAGHADTSALSSATVDEKTGEGVYFPAITSTETPTVRFPKLAGVGPQQRSVVVDQLNVAVATNGGVFPIVVQAVGEDRATLALTYMHTDSAMTPYIARAILARLTSLVRFLPAVTELGVSSEIDVYNMASVLGFDQIIVSDGRGFAHSANLRQN